MTGWWDEIDDDRSADRKKAERLVNVIARLKGDRAEKVTWLINHMALLEAEAGKKVDAVEEPKRFAAEMKSLAFRFYRNQLADGYRPRMNRDRERPQEIRGTTRKGAPFVSVGKVIVDELAKQKPEGSA